MILEGIADLFKDFINRLIPNWVSFVVQIAATLILITVVIIFGYKPIKKIITKRQDYVENNIKDSESAKIKAEENFTQSEEKLIASRKEANQIIEEAKLTAEKEGQRIIENANNVANKMRNDALIDIEESKQKAQEEIRKEIVNLALDASSEILKREVSEEDNKRLTEDFLKDVSK